MAEEEPSKQEPDDLVIYAAFVKESPVVWDVPYPKSFTS